LGIGVPVYFLTGFLTGKTLTGFFGFLGHDQFFWFLDR
jgi:hypothetical protein